MWYWYALGIVLLIIVIEVHAKMMSMPPIWIVRGSGKVSELEFMNGDGMAVVGYEEAKSFHFYSPYKKKVLQEMKLNDPNWRFKRMHIPVTKVALKNKGKIKW